MFLPTLTKHDIDYVLFIGGSTNNPYVQAALKEYFDDSDLLIPRDLQTHVSAGAAIHSLVYNGFNKNIIQPITSEPIIVITKDDTPRVVVKSGTHIPCVDIKAEIEKLLIQEFEYVPFHNLFMLNDFNCVGTKLGGTCSDKVIHFKKILAKNGVESRLHSAIINGLDCHRLLTVEIYEDKYYIDVGSGLDDIKWIIQSCQLEVITLHRKAH